jgi:hypothetical protein
MAGPNKVAGLLKELVSPRDLVRIAAAGVLAYAGYNVWDNSAYETHPITCTAGVPKKVAEGKVDSSRPFAEFSATTADGESVARIVVAASVDNGRVPIAGLQVLRGRSVPRADVSKTAVAALLDGETVMAQPTDTTNFNFVEGKGQTAVLSIDKTNTVEVYVTQADSSEAKLTAACIASK